MGKLRVKAADIQYLSAVDHYIKQYNIRGPNLESAPSDVLDGAVYRDEIDSLVRRRIFYVVRFRKPFSEMNDNLCGSCWTIGFTRRAIRRLYANRARPIRRQAAAQGEGRQFLPLPSRKGHK
jgi:hypothetical protein